MSQTATVTTPLETVESIYDAFRSGNIPHIVSLVAPGAVWKQSKMVPWGGDFRGPEGAVEFFTKLDAAMENHGLDVFENVTVGNEVFTFGRYTAKARSTGRPVAMDLMFRWRAENGRIVSYESYIDSGVVMAALA